MRAVCRKRFHTLVFAVRTSLETEHQRWAALCGFEPNFVRHKAIKLSPRGQRRKDVLPHARDVHRHKPFGKAFAPIHGMLVRMCSDAFHIQHNTPVPDGHVCMKLIRVQLNLITHRTLHTTCAPLPRAHKHITDTIYSILIHYFINRTRRAHTAQLYVCVVQLKCVRFAHNTCMCYRPISFIYMCICIR